MADDGDNAPTIVIKKKKKVVGHGHHGGAWKVAYADFVTAMMAFFLLLWLLNVTTEEQRQGIADYFSPTTVTKTSSGGGGMLQGRTLAKEGALASKRTAVGITVPLAQAPERQESPPEEGEREQGEQGERGESAEDISDEDLDKALAEREAERFAQAEAQLRQAIQEVPDLKQLAQNLLVDRTPEGMRIQLVDQEGLSMFPLGSADMHDKTKRLLGLVADAVERLPNRVAIKGHTDAKPFHGKGDYTNWELSSDRANASRRALVEAGLSAERIAYVVGRADQDPLFPDDPTSPRNRRISIVLLHENAEPFQEDAAQRTGTGEDPDTPTAEPRG